MFDYYKAYSKKGGLYSFPWFNVLSKIGEHNRNRINSNQCGYSEQVLVGAKS